MITATIRDPHRPEENRGKENTCLIRLSWIISSELHLRCSDEEPLNEGISEEPGPLQEGTDTEESQPDFTYDYGCVLYDANGNQTRKTNKTTGEITQFEYDAENKLVRVVRDGTTINYRYDGLGRRVEKEINDGATTKITRYILDQEDVLLELDGSNNIVARYTHGPGIDEPLILEKAGQSFFYHADGLGSITELTDVNGSVVKSYSYSSFGKIESETNPTFFQPYSFTAREFDLETDLYHYRQRQYDWRTGRFTSEDLYNLATQQLPFQFRQFVFPSRVTLPSLKTNSQNQNRYPHVGNNPINRMDPFGLAETCTWGGFSFTAAIGMGFQLSVQKGWCTDDCGNSRWKTRNCICATAGLGASVGVGAEAGDTSRSAEGWSIATPKISVSGSGGTVTGGTFGPGLGAFYSWCGCDVF